MEMIGWIRQQVEIPVDLSSFFDVAMGILTVLFNRQILTYLGTAAVFGSFWTALSLAVPNLYIRIFMTPTERILEIAPAESYAGAVGYSAICMSGLLFIYGYNAVSAILHGISGPGTGKRGEMALFGQKACGNGGILLKLDRIIGI